MKTFVNKYLPLTLAAILIVGSIGFWQFRSQTAQAVTTTTFMEPGTDATQDLSFYGTTTGTVASATDQQHTGPRSVKLSTGAGATSAFLASKTGIMADSGTRISFWWRADKFAAAPSFLNIDDGASTVTSLGFNATTDRVSNAPTGATAVTGITPIVVNTWYHITLSYYITNTTTFQFKVYVNGVLDSTANSGTLTRTGTSRFQLRCGSGFGANANEWYDDIYVDNGASSGSQPDTGNILVTAKRPNANGTANNFSTQIGAGGSGYGTGHSPQVNEQPLSTTNGWSMIGAGSAVTEEYTIENASTGDVDMTGATIVDYMGWVYAKSLSSETGSIVVGGASSNISLTSSNTMFTKAAGSTTYPAGGTDIGVVTDTTLTTVSLYEAGVIFAYTPAVATANPAFLQFE